MIAGASVKKYRSIGGKMKYPIAMDYLKDWKRRG